MPDQVSLIGRILAFALALPPLGVYAFLIISSLLQQWFPPYPSDTFLVLFAALSATKAFSPALVLLSYLSATLISTYVLYELGYRNGDKLLKIRFVNRFLVGESAQNGVRMIRQYGAFTLMLCKFVPGINTIVLLLAGIIRISRRKAYIFMTAAAVVHNSILFAAGFVIGDNIEGIEKFLSKLGLWGAVTAAVAALVIAVVVLTIKKRKKADNTGNGLDLSDIETAAARDAAARSEK